MSRSIRRGWTASRARFWVILVSIAIASSVFATEPDGHLQLQADWVPADAKGHSPIVRLHIRSLVPLDDATLTVSTPLDFDLRTLAPSAEVEFRPVRAAQDRRAIRTDLRHLDPAVSSKYDFEWILSPGGNGILEFIVEARDPTGRTIRNAIGFAAAESAAAGVHRLSAIEFPATVLPRAEKR